MTKILILSESTNWYFFPQVNGASSLGIRRFVKNAGGLRVTHQLRKRGHTVKQIHNFTCFTLDELLEIIKRFSNDGKEKFILGISTSFLMIHKGTKDYDHTYSKIKNLLVKAKEYGALIVVGGWMVSRQFKPMTYMGNIFTLLNKEVDYFIEGDGTDAMDRLANNLPIEYILLDNNKYHIAPQIIDFTEQSSAPLPSDHIAQDESLVTEVSSGCIFSCSFCNYGVLGKKKHEFVRTYESLKEEIVGNWQNFGTRVYTFTDNIFNDNSEKLDMLIRLREETNIDLRWVGYIRLDTLTKRSQMQQLKDAGIAGLNMGIESFKKSVGPLIGKSTDKEKLVPLLHELRDVLGNTAVFTASFISGLPTDTIEDNYKTHEWLMSKEGRFLLDSYKFVRLYLSPKPELREELKMKNAINIARGDPFDCYKKHGELGGWISPWGHSDDFDKFVKECNGTRGTPGTTWSLPSIHTTSQKIEDCIRDVRTGRPFDTEKFKANTLKLISAYKGKVLAE
jgi:radical SAM superfamily enzyme YgiQ (UPF0313 family)